MLRSTMLRNTMLAARARTAPVARRQLSSDALVESGAKYVDKGQGIPTTMTYANRPAWIAPSKDHWLVSGVDKLGPGTSTAAIIGLVTASAWTIIEVNNSKYSGNDPVSINPKWERATAEMKLGKRRIYWETRAAPSDDDDDDDDDE